MQKAQSKTTVYQWYTEFNNGRGFLNDEYRKGQPKLFIVQENVDIVSKMIVQDCHITYGAVTVPLGICGTSFQPILQDLLRTRKICSCWIQHEQIIEHVHHHG